MSEDHKKQLQQHNFGKSPTHSEVKWLLFKYNLSF
jgi:hypothetical protein